MIRSLVLGSLLASLVVAQTTITVNTATKYQQIDGFGFSQAFGRAREFQNANSTLRSAALDLLFSTTTGAGFSIIRNRIGSGGSGDSILPTSPGSPTGTPTYVWDNDDRGQVWFTKEAVARGVKTIYADAWSAPGFMKTSGNEATAGFLCGTTGHTCSSGDWRQAYANFLVQYIKYYNGIGCPVTHVGFLNEPDYQVSYSQMQIGSNAAEAISFIPTLYNTIKSAGLSTKIACCDPVGWRSQQTYQPYLNSSGVLSQLGVITSHSYSADALKLQTTLPTWNTEAGTGSSFPLITTWYSSNAANEGFFWAQKLSNAMITAELSAYLYWEGFEVGQQQSGSHLLDNNGNSVVSSGIFWAFAMWSRHIRPGARRIATSGTISSVQIGAFQNTDGTIVVMFTNSGTGAQSAKVAFSGFTLGSASAWATSQGQTFASINAAVSGGAVTVSVPAHGVVTLKASSGGGNPSTTTSTTPTTTTTPPSGCTVALYGQCGGQDYTGCTTCASGSTCKYSNPYYSQCL